MTSNDFKRVGDLSKITIHPLGANGSKKRPAEIFSSALQRATKQTWCNSARGRGQSAQQIRRPLVFCMGWVLWETREEGELPQTKNIKGTLSITISVRLISYVDVGHMRLRRRWPGSIDQDKDFGVKQRIERVHGSIGFRRCSSCHNLLI